MTEIAQSSMDGLWDERGAHDYLSMKDRKPTIFLGKLILVSE
ncbi:MAG: hypothetical protein VB778_04605 [Nitrospinaceae bacterium]